MLMEGLDLNNIVCELYMDQIVNNTGHLPTRAGITNR